MTEPVIAEVVGFRDNKVLIMPLGELGGIGVGSEVVALGASAFVGVSDQLLGRVLDGSGRPIDGRARSSPIVRVRHGRAAAIR